MPNEILDKPLGFQPIRKFYYNIIEYSIILCSGTAVLGGIGICWYFALTDITNKWLLLINPPCFILLFGMPFVVYINNWRKATLHFDKSGEYLGFKELSNQLNEGFSFFFANISFTIISFIVNLIGEAFLLFALMFLLKDIFHLFDPLINLFNTFSFFVLVLPVIQAIFIYRTKKIVHTLGAKEISLQQQ